MHFVNQISSRATIRATIKNIQVIEHNSALSEINRHLMNNSKLYLAEQLLVCGLADVRIHKIKCAINVGADNE